MTAEEGSGCYRAVFLDRDGTINIEKDYLHRVEDFEFIDGVPEAILRLNRAGMKVIVVTNQSGIARGYFSLEQVQRLHAHIDCLLADYGARINGYYICPHHPDYDPEPCRCRKPEAGMLLQAAAEQRIDLQHSFMIGDKLADIHAGEAAGCMPLLVKTGYGERTMQDNPDLRSKVFNALPQVVDRILGDNSN